MVQLRIPGRAIIKFLFLEQYFYLKGNAKCKSESRVTTRVLEMERDFYDYVILWLQLYDDEIIGKNLSTGNIVYKTST